MTTTSKKLASVLAVLAVALGASLTMTSTVHAAERSAQLSVSVVVTSSCAFSTPNGTTEASCHAAPAPRMDVARNVVVPGAEGLFTITSAQF